VSPADVANQLFGLLSVAPVKVSVSVPGAASEGVAETIALSNGAHSAIRTIRTIFFMVPPDINKSLRKHTHEMNPCPDETNSFMRYSPGGKDLWRLHFVEG
jgi:hypothetical protein